jgi:hypothetical protein
MHEIDDGRLRIARRACHACQEPQSSGFQHRYDSRRKRSAKELPGTIPLQLQAKCSIIIAIRLERHKCSFVGLLRSEEDADCPGVPSHTAFAPPRNVEPRKRTSQKSTETARAALKLLRRRLLSTTDASIGPSLPGLLNAVTSPVILGQHRTNQINTHTHIHKAISIWPQHMTLQPQLLEQHAALKHRCSTSELCTHKYILHPNKLLHDSCPDQEAGLCSIFKYIVCTA